MYFKVAVFVIAMLFGGAFGSAVGSIVGAILVLLALAVSGHVNVVAVLDASFNSQPWGYAACGVAAIKYLGAATGAWLAWRGASKLLPKFPPALLQHSRRSLAVFVLAEIVFLLFFIPAMRLAAHYETVTGKVTALHPHDHANVSYVYEVAGRRFGGYTSPERFDAVHVGDPIAVYFESGRPGNSALEEPRGLLIKSLLMTLLLSGFFGLWVHVPFTHEARMQWSPRGSSAS